MTGVNSSYERAYALVGEEQINRYKRMYADIERMEAEALEMRTKLGKAVIRKFADKGCTLCRRIREEVLKDLDKYEQQAFFSTCEIPKELIDKTIRSDLCLEGFSELGGDECIKWYLPLREKE